MQANVRELVRTICSVNPVVLRSVGRFADGLRRNAVGIDLWSLDPLANIAPIAPLVRLQISWGFASDYAIRCEMFEQDRTLQQRLLFETGELIKQILHSKSIKGLVAELLQEPRNKPLNNRSCYVRVLIGGQRIGWRVNRLSRWFTHSTNRT